MKNTFKLLSETYDVSLKNMENRQHIHLELPFITTLPITVQIYFFLSLIRTCMFLHSNFCSHYYYYYYHYYLHINLNILSSAFARNLLLLLVWPLTSSNTSLPITFFSGQLAKSYLPLPQSTPRSQQEQV